MSELVVVTSTQRKFRRTIPAEHRTSLDTRLQWLWVQRFGTVQQIWNSSPDVLDVTAATLILQAIMAKDLGSIQQLFDRLEGGSIIDTEVLDAEGEQRTMRL